MFWIFLLIAGLGGWIVGGAVYRGQAGLAVVGAIIAMIGIFGNAGAFG